MRIELREITSETVLHVIALRVAPDQAHFVAPNANSLAEALFSEDAWYWAVWRGDQLVGFVMLEDQSLRRPPPAAPRLGLWRLMVDARFQRQGVGKGIVAAVVAMAQARGFGRLYTSYRAGEHGPEGFYRTLGFVPTGELDGDEVVAALPLAPAPRPPAFTLA